MSLEMLLKRNGAAAAVLEGHRGVKGIQGGDEPSLIWTHSGTWFDFRDVSGVRRSCWCGVLSGPAVESFARSHGIKLICRSSNRQG
jgi:hypothetical protein